MTESEHAAGQAEPPPEEGDASGSPAPPAWLSDILDAAAAIRELAAAQWRLFSAELALARSATHGLLLASLVAVVFAVALGLTLLALLGWGLAHWFGSWALGLAVLSLLQLAGLAAALWFARRCMRWMTLPATRAEWRAMMRQTHREGEDGRHAPDSTQT